MKLCWDNIENIKLTKKGLFRDIVKKYSYHLKICKQCNIEFLGLNGNSKFCCLSCINKGRKHTEKAKKKIGLASKNRIVTDIHRKRISKSLKKRFKNIENHPMYGKQHTEKTKLKIKNAQKGGKGNNWKGGYDKKGIPLYDTYAHQIKWCEEIRRNKDDSNILEVKCFKCDKWYIPTKQNVHHRIQILKENKSYKGEHRFYCSNECKNSCSIYGKKPETIMKEDAIRAGRLGWLELTKEVQPELRSIVLERDEHKCVKCNNVKDLQCHHIYPVNIEPLLSADIDNCITLCKECHIEVHKKDGCRYNQLHIKEC